MYFDQLQAKDETISIQRQKNKTKTIITIISIAFNLNAKY